ASALQAVLPAFGPNISVAFGVVETRREMQVARVMGAADSALARAESRGAYEVEFAEVDSEAGERSGTLSMGEGAWRRSLDTALSHGRMRLVNFPLIGPDRELIHLESPMRLQLQPEGEYETAARWLPFALRARLTSAIDERAVELALAGIESDGRP